MTVLMSLRINVLIEIFCQGSLEQHIKRVNYQVAIWKLVLTPKPTVPSPVEGHGWTTGQQGIEPLWVDGNVLPQALVDEDEMISDSSDDE